MRATPRFHTVSVSVHTYLRLYCIREFLRCVYFSPFLFYHRTPASCFNAMRTPFSLCQYGSWFFSHTHTVTLLPLPFRERNEHSSWMERKKKKKRKKHVGNYCFTHLQTSKNQVQSLLRNKRNKRSRHRVNLNRVRNVFLSDETTWRKRLRDKFIRWCSEEKSVRI